MLDKIRASVVVAATLASAALFAAARPHDASAQHEPAVGITVDGALGNELLGSGTWLPIVVTLQNRTDTTQRGRIEVRHDWYRSPGPAVVAPFSVSPRGSVAVPMLVPGNGSPSSALNVTATGSRAQLLGSTVRSFSFRPGPSILVVGDRIALPRALAGETYVDPREEYRHDGVATRARPMVGIPAIDLADSASPVEQLPTTPLAYGGIRLVVARLAALESLGTREREALLDWVHTGGRVLVLRGSQTASLPAWIGTLDTRDANAATAGRRLGFGWLWVTSADFPAEHESPTQFSESTLNVAIASVLQRDVSPGDVSALSVGWAAGHPRGPAALDSRASSQLDPNRVSAAWLAVAGLLLVLYVVAVGPLNFKLLTRRPALALLTTPLLAGVCALLLLGVGVLHKGVRNRYRRVELLETTAGSTRVTSNRFTAAFFAHPSSVEVGFDGSHLATLQASRDDALATTSSFATGRQRVQPFEVGTWDTVGLHEEAVLPFGDGIHVDAEPHGGGTVHNRTGRWLRGAVVLEGSRSCRIGDIAPGGEGRFRDCRFSPRVDLDPDRLRQATTDPYAFLRYQSYPTYEVPGSTAAILTPDLELRQLLEPFVQMARTSYALPVLLARLEPDGRDPFDGDVAREADVTLVRIVPALPSGRDWIAPTASSPVIEDALGRGTEELTR